MKGEHTKHRQEEGEYSETKGILRTKIVTSRVTVTKIMWIFIIKKWCDSFVGPHLKEQCAVMTTVAALEGAMCCKDNGGRTRRSNVL